MKSARRLSAEGGVQAALGLRVRDAEPRDMAMDGMWISTATHIPGGRQGVIRAEPQS